MKFSAIRTPEKRSLDLDEAAEFVGGIGNLRMYRALGWLAPYIERHRMTRFDLNDLHAAIDRHKQTGDEEARRQLETAAVAA